MSRHTILQAARRTALDVQSKRRRERAEREKRLEDIAVRVLVAVGERDQAVADSERRAGEALREMTGDEGLTLREAIEWCGEEITVREATRLRRLAEQDPQTTPECGRPAPETNDLYELIVERHRKTATIVTSNREPSEWMSTMSDALLAESAIDRLTSRDTLIIEGPSYRQRDRVNQRQRCHPKRDPRCSLTPPGGPMLMATRWSHHAGKRKVAPTPYPRRSGGGPRRQNKFNWTTHVSGQTQGLTGAPASAPATGQFCGRVFRDTVPGAPAVTCSVLVRGPATGTRAFGP